VKVVDFGIAKVINDTAASPVSRIMGTPHYSSPEQFRIGADIDGRSDIYSLGVLLFQMLTGRLPFDGATPEEIMLLHRTGSPPPVRGFRPDAPVAVEQLVERMLAKEPQFRPRTATEAAEVFERAISSPDQARTAPATRVITKDAPPAITQDAPPVITSGKTEPEQYQLSFLPTQVEAPVSAGDRVTTPLAPALATPKAAPPAAPHSQRQAFELKGSDGPGRGLKRLAVVVGAMLLLFLAGMLIRRMIILSRAPASARELMAYQLEILSADGKTLRRASGETRLANGESFKLRFTPRESGYLYILAPDAENNPATFLTTQPDKKSGVTTNRIEAETDFSFPADPDGWLEITPGESKMDFTLIFSSTEMREPGFLAAPAGHKLTGEEQHELNELRKQSVKDQIEVSPDADFSRILLRRVDASPTRPAVVELTVRRQ
ncbi:MAG: protein kinase domain-containing protein, partial [Blastocatellia bacterium]